jgi:hypothetical protein
VFGRFPFRVSYLAPIFVSVRVSVLRICRLVSPRGLTGWSLGMVGDCIGRAQLVDIPVTLDAQCPTIVIQKRGG